MLKEFIQKKFVRFIGISFGGMFVTLFLTMANSILTARILGPEDKGLYTLLYTTMMLAIALFAPKAALGQVYYRKDYDFNVLTSNSIFISLVTGVLAVLPAAVAIPFFYDEVFSGAEPKLVIIMLVTTPLFLFATNMRTMLVADYDIPGATFVKITRPAFFLLAFSVAAVFGIVDLETAVICIFLSVVGMSLLSFIMIIKRGFNRFKVDFSLVKSMLSFSLKTHFGLLFRFLQNRFDIFLVAYFLPAKEVGIYSIALVIAEILWRIPRVVNTVLLPRLSGESDRRSAEITAKMNRVVFAVTLLCLVPFALTVEWFIPLLYGVEYQDAAQVILVLLPGVLAISVFKLLVPNLIIRGRAWTYSLSVLSSLIVMIILDMFMIPRYGILGAGIASSIAYTTACLVVLVTVVRMNDLPLRSYFDFFADLGELKRLRAGS